MSGYFSSIHIESAIEILSDMTSNNHDASSLFCATRNFIHQKEFIMSPIMDNAELMLTGLIKDLKESHKRIAEYEAHIARERQLISSKIEAHQARLALRRVQRKALAPHESSASLSSVSIQMAS